MTLYTKHLGKILDKAFAKDQIKAHSLVIIESAMQSRGFDRAYNIEEKAWVDYVNAAMSLHGEKEEWVDMGYIMNFALMPEVGLKDMFPDKY